VAAAAIAISMHAPFLLLSVLTTTSVISKPLS
jgi:hypothetical protein